MEYMAAQMDSQIEGAISENERLANENEELRRDAERYRWLRNCGEEYKQLPILNYRGHLDAEFLDRAIDAAMAGANT